jgi:transcriptional regulator with XRE-family HTH domain
MMNDDELLQSFGTRVRTLRKAVGLSQEALADRCGLDRTYVGGIERGERNPSLRNIARIAGALNKSLSDLMRGVRFSDSR